MSRDEIVELYLRGAMSRRTFVRRMMAAGLSITAAVSYAELLRPSEAQAARGRDLYFYDHLLPPDVVTGAATDLTPTTATLHATVDPNFHTTTVSFLWGLAADQLTNTVAVPTTVGSPQDQDGPSSGARDVAASLTGLAAATTYYVQARGQNSKGTTFGAVVPFTTASTTPTPTPTPAPTPTPTPAQVPTPAQTPGPDRTPPVVTVTLLTRKRSSLLKKGLAAQITLNEPGSVTVVVRDGRGRQLSTSSSGLASYRSAGSATVYAKLTPAAKRRVRLGSKLRWTVEVLANDGYGNATTSTVAFNLG